MQPPKKEGLMIAIGMKPPALKAPGSKYGDDPQPPQAHEAAESPDEESSEEYGSKLLSDIDAVGQKFGADSQTARAACSAFLSAIAKCLSGDSGESSAVAEHDAGGQSFEGSDEGYE